MNKIFFYASDKNVSLKNKTSVKKLIIFLFKQEKVYLNEICYVFCSDDYLLKLNQQYLKHNTLTDVITFPLSTNNQPVTGEIFLSIDRIKENSKKFKVLYQSELLRVIIHGALHLCGYMDDTYGTKKQMRAKENYYLKKFDVSREAYIQTSLLDNKF